MENHRPDCHGNFYWETACGVCEKCIRNRKQILDSVLPKTNMDDEFDQWVAEKPSYYNEEHRNTWRMAWKKARGEK